MLQVGIGLAVLGATSYVYLSVSARQLSVAGFASISVLWSVIYIVGPGVFQPFEQQIGRDLATRLARGRNGLGRQTRVVGLAVVVVLGLSALTVTFGRPLAGMLFGGSAAVVIALLLSYAALAAAYLYRGVLAGAGRFDLYGAQLAIEGAARFVGCIVIWRWGSPSVRAFAFLIPLAQAVSVVATARPGRVLLKSHSAARPGAGRVSAAGSAEPGRPGHVGVGILWLVAAAVLSQALVNASTLLARLLDHNDPVLVGHLQAGLLIARVPLLLFAAIPAALLPRLAGLAATGRFAAMRRRTNAVIAGVGLTMAAATVLAGGVGPEVVRLFFGPSFTLSGSTLAALTGGTGLFMMAGVAATAVLAGGRFGRAVLGWGCGVAAMIAALAFPGSPSGRIIGGFLAGTAVSFVLLSVLSRLPLADRGSDLDDIDQAGSGIRIGRRCVAGPVGDES